MATSPAAPAAFSLSPSGHLSLSGRWTALGTGALGRDKLEAMRPSGREALVIDGSRLEAFDTVGARVLQDLVARLRSDGHQVELRGFDERNTKLLELASEKPPALPAAPPEPGLVERIGRATVEIGISAGKLVAFVGEAGVTLAAGLRQPSRIRWRPILFNIHTAGFDALPIVGLLSFLIGVVVGYQSSAQLHRYGADIFVADLVGLSIVREFGPLVTAIIVAGRSASAYAAQIGTMSVTEEIDAMRTIGISPVELLVLPKIIAMIVVLPLLTFFSDLAGIYGGALMARGQLEMGLGTFIDRLTAAVSPTAYLIGLGKAPVFAAIIAVVGCYQGFQTRGGADAVGRQTTRAVVQSIFLVIVTDSLFSIVLSFLDL